MGRAAYEAGSGSGEPAGEESPKNRLTPRTAIAPPRNRIMKIHSLRHLTNEALIRDLTALVTTDRTTTAALVAHVAEMDARRLFRPLGYSSMFQYCVRELGMSEDVAYKRINVGRLAQRFPAILSGLADGRLHLSGDQNSPVPGRVTVTNAEHIAAPVRCRPRNTRCR